MDPLVRQLAQARRRARWLLVAGRLAQCTAALVLAALVAGWADFFLRLPGWLRLVVGLATLAAAVGWLASRLPRAWRFGPSLAAIALRIEHRVPALRGHLAARADLATGAVLAGSPRSGRMARSSLARFEPDREAIGQVALIDPAGPLRRSGLALAALLAAAGMVAAWPREASLAAQRWTAPLGAVAWPTRTRIIALPTAAVWPNDTPVRLAARIERGHHGKLRAWALWRPVDAQGRAGRWRRTLMSDQGRGVYERLLDPSELAESGEGMPARIAYRFEAGDDTTAAGTLELVERPALLEVAGELTPPTYARGLLEPLSAAPETGADGVATVAGPAGSEARLTLTFNKALPAASLDPAALAPGLEGLAGLAVTPGADFRSATVAFTLDRSATTPMVLTDGHGIDDASDRIYRFEAIEDQPPSAQVAEPAADTAVLATARLTAIAAGRDDVGLAELALERRIDRASAGGEPGPWRTVAAATRRERIVRVPADMDLATLELVPGDTLEISALARDVFEYGGRTHPAVRSTIRRLRIIDEATLLAEVRAELDGLRRQAVRLTERQRELQGTEAAAATDGQHAVTRGVEAQGELARRLARRLERNRVEEPALARRLEKSRELLEEAAAASSRARQALAEAAEPEAPPERERAGREAQARARSALVELAALLDEGRDALALRLELRELAEAQGRLRREAEKMLLETVGRSLEDLSESQRRALEEMAGTQRELGERAAAATEKMQAAAEAMRESGDPEQQATAEALAEASDLARDQELPESMASAAREAAGNRLSSASRSQQQSQQTLEEMIDKLGEEARRRQEVLRRRLARLAALLEKLLEDQRSLAGRTAEARKPAALADDQSRLRVNTLAAEQQAGEAPETRAAAEPIGEAADYQRRAIDALEATGEGEPAGEASLQQRQAIDALERALERVTAARRAAGREQAARERTELREAYEKLARTQRQLREQTAGIAGEADPGRRQRAGLVRLGHEEADLRIAAQDLAGRTGETLVFERMHELVDETTARITRRLRAAEADQGVLADQELVARTLARMAAALEQERSDEAFDRQAQGSEGGAGGGSSPPPPPVPPLAELKLLHGMQEALRDATRDAADAARPTMNQAQRRRLLRLSLQQRELAGLTRQILESLGQRPEAPDGSAPAPEPEEPESAPEP